MPRQAAPPPSPTLTPRMIAAALVLGAAGGIVFAYFRLPLAWMLGAMVVTTVAALAGASIGFPSRWRSAMLAILGVMLGSSFGPDLPARAAQWGTTLAGLVVYIGVAASIGYVYLRRLGGAAPVDAYFTAMPGGLNEMTMLGGAMGGDERLISLSHAVRLLLVVFTVPFWFRFFEGYVSSGRPGTGGSLLDTAPADLAILAGCAVIGPIAARWLRTPAPHLTGPMALSALAHVFGLTRSSVPPELVIIAQIGIGAALGCRFAGLPLRQVIGTIRLAFGLGIMLLGCTVAISLALHSLTGIPVDALLLAFSPGGFAEMSLVALALNIDTAFVATHQLLRILLVIFLAPLFFQLLPGRRLAEAERPAPGDD